MNQFNNRPSRWLFSLLRTYLHRIKIQCKITSRAYGSNNIYFILMIFQSFFTTKPTGQGLSLSYDIVTKGHRGELKVSTEEGKGTEFIIQIPMK